MKLFIAGLVAFASIFLNVATVAAESIVTDCDMVTIHGYVTLHGSDSASVWFEWGPTANLGNQTLRQNFYQDSSFSQIISNLTEDKTYYYRAIGSTDNGQPEVGSIKSFKVLCDNGNGGTNNKPTVDIRADDTTVDFDETTIIRWSSTNADTCRASNGDDGWSGSKVKSGSYRTDELTDTTTFRITCTNKNGSDDDSVTVSVNEEEEKPTVTISANPVSVYSGNSSIITWSSDNADTCRGTNGINGWSGSKARSGSFNTGALTRGITFTITCTNDAGSRSDSTAVSVISNPVNNFPTVSIYADSTNLGYGGATTVRWSTTNASSCNATGGSIGWAGARSIGPASFYTGSLTGSRTYSISCSNNSGTAFDSVTVSVRPLIVNNNPRPVASSLVLINSSIDRNQPIVPTIDNTNPRPGDEINYTVTYQNIGTGAITNLTLRLDLPYEVDYMFSNPNNPTRSGQTLIFNLGTLRANGQGTVTVRVRVRNNIEPGTNLNFPATLTYRDPSGYTQSVNANVSAQVWRDGINITDNEDKTTTLGANVFGAGFMPTNIFGWLLTLIMILILVLLAKYLFTEPRQRVATVYEDDRHRDHMNNLPH